SAPILSRRPRSTKSSVSAAAGRSAGLPKARDATFTSSDFDVVLAMPDVVTWNCPTCNVAVTTPFCAGCGEEPLPPRDLTLRGLAENVWHAITSIDARATRSAWTLLRHPGRLTVAWTTGVRKPYVAPFQLFLIANVIFFALQSLTGQNVFSSSLDSHLHHQDWSDLAQTLDRKSTRLNSSH